MDLSHRAAARETSMTSLRSGRAHALFIAALMLCEVAAAFETSMIYAAMAKLVAEFGDPNTAAWLITGYLLTGAGVAAVMGRLGDLYGRKEIMLALLAIGVLGSVVSGLSANFFLVLAGRCLQGLTGALLPLCFGLIREHVPEKRVALVIGLVVTGASIGASSGLIIGGLIVDAAPWRWIFLASAALASSAALVGWFFIPATRVRAGRTRLDLLGGLMFVPGIALLLLAISRGDSWGWISPAVLGSSAMGIALLVAWGIRSARQSNPLIDVRLFANRNILIANLATAAVALGAMQILQVFALLLQQPTWTRVGLGISATLAGLVKLPSNVLSLTAGPIAGILAARLGDRRILFTAGLLTAVGWLCAWVFHGSIPEVIAILSVISFGTTMVAALVPSIVVKTTPPERASEATGLIVVTRATFMGAGAQLVAVLLSANATVSNQHSGRYPSEAGYSIVFLSIAAITVLISILSLGLTTKRMSSQPKADQEVQAATPGD